MRSQYICNEWSVISLYKHDAKCNKPFTQNMTVSLKLPQSVLSVPHTINDEIFKAENFYGLPKQKHKSFLL